MYCCIVCIIVLYVLLNYICCCIVCIAVLYVFSPSVVIFCKVFHKLVKKLMLRIFVIFRTKCKRNLHEGVFY